MNGYFNGTLDVVGIWDRALTGSEIAVLAAPEPSTALLLSLGLVGLSARRRALRA